MTWFSSIQVKANDMFSEKVVRIFCYSVDHIIGTLWLAMFALSLFPKGKDFKHLFDKPPYSIYSTASAIAVVLSALFYWTGLFTCNPPDPEAFLGPRRPHDFDRLGIVEGSPDPPYFERIMERRARAEAITRHTTTTTAPPSSSDPDAIELQDMNGSKRPRAKVSRTNSDPNAIEQQDMSVPNRPRANASSRAVIYV
ncbi:MAG: hypothetical protein LQ351_002797 [Letrouitia transgressa]|nr:MAG: hypothetical protein LQ351_002797 [Letrouitia transgressa]